MLNLMLFRFNSETIRSKNVLLLHTTILAQLAVAYVMTLRIDHLLKTVFSNLNLIGKRIVSLFASSSSGDFFYSAL